ncbi:complement resistance protein TraT [Marinomonas sp. RSW2]|uniref:Complement resistance protein TraT n=1 Tax=Marinomonas maritima TaxID=2940935 RepID=A0ABT5W9X7_9GAMM|nr:complement resistance protein TraT [Marinomonas maritima]MDE8601626.1 complement resistance protein TraT [Marinomonas maritima]
MSGGSGSDNRRAGLFAGAAGFFADAIVEDAYFTFVMDVQMRERALDGDSVSNSTQNKSIKGISTGNAANLSLTKSSVKRGSDYNWIIYETRIVTTANQMNLKMEEALPAVKERTALSLSELML